MSTMRTAKRGDTFAVSIERDNDDGSPFNITATVIASQVRRRGFVQTLTVTKTNPTAGLLAVSATAAQTALWPPGILKCDVQFTDGADVRSTMTFDILVEEDVTV
mgnify:CR=1 FL=1